MGLPQGGAIDKLYFKSRTVIVAGTVNDKLAQRTVAHLLALAEESDAPINMLISSPGGHVESGETASRAAVRELAEESGLITAVGALEFAGVVDFHFPARPAWSMATSLFTTRRWTGQLTETDEIAPAWFAHDALPVDRMWADAEHWLPRMLAGERRHTVVVLADDNTTVRTTWSSLLTP